MGAHVLNNLLMIHPFNGFRTICYEVMQNGEILIVINISFRFVS